MGRQGAVTRAAAGGTRALALAPPPRQRGSPFARLVTGHHDGRVLGGTDLGGESRRCRLHLCRLVDVVERGREGRRLLDTLGCVALLPMVLATLGSVFAATGVGDAIAAIVSALIPVDNRYACLAAFALGMVLFTAIMGNAFAAFPVRRKTRNAVRRRP